VADPDNFLSRWSRRKAQARADSETAVPTPPGTPIVPFVAPAQPQPASVSVSAPVSVAAAAPATPHATDAQHWPDDPHGHEARTAAAPQPTLDDVAALTHESDYARFVAREVAPEVRNAALKKLFSDPHFNVMDGLDTYIEDYGIPNPIPPEMLRLMSQTQFLGLFTDKVDSGGDSEIDSEAATAGPTTVTASTVAAAAKHGADAASPPIAPDPVAAADGTPESAKAEPARATPTAPHIPA
jgi:hypothetical protein